MAPVVKNKQVLFKNYIDGFPKESDMVVSSDATICLELPKDEPGVILTKNLYLSCDPMMRNRMTEAYEGAYIASFTPGSPLIGIGVSKVVDSTHPDFKIGDYVTGFTNWEEYSVVKEPQYLTKIHHTDVPLSYYTGILGMAGMTAYVGFYEYCSAKKGEYFFVSAAAGAIGQLAGQFAKLAGCYVVGCAGSTEKVELLKTKFGFDEAFNYKEVDLDAALKKYFPKGIDVYFDNVGGKMLDTVLLNMRVHGRVASCGMISQYNKVGQPDGIYNLQQLSFNRLKILGFTFADHLDLYPKYYELVLPLIREKKIVYIEDVCEGLDNGPSALIGLFSGENVGKKLVVVSHD